MYLHIFRYFCKETDTSCRLLNNFSMKYIFFLWFLCLLAIDGTAQSNPNKKDKNKAAASSRSASTVEPGSENAIFMDTKTTAANRKSGRKTTEDLKQEYRDRMEA